MYDTIQKSYSGWGLAPGATSQNLSRSLKGSNEGYGGVSRGYTSDAIAKRREQIAANFATKQAQLAEAARQEAANRSYSLAERGLTERERARKWDEDQRKAEWEKANDWREKDFTFAKDKWDDMVANRQSSQEKEAERYQTQLDIANRQSYQQRQQRQQVPQMTAARRPALAPPPVQKPGTMGYSMQTGRNGQMVYIDNATGQIVNQGVARPSQGGPGAPPDDRTGAYAVERQKIQDQIARRKDESTSPGYDAVLAALYKKLDELQW